MSIKSDRDLRVWQAGMDPMVEVDELTNRFPDHERFGLTSSLRLYALRNASLARD